MFKRFCALVALITLCACTTTNSKTALVLEREPLPNARVLLMQPHVELALLTAGGVEEPRADWSKAAAENLSRSIQSQLEHHAFKFQTMNPDEVVDGRTGQLLRLNEAVGQSIMLFSYGPYTLPNKKKRLEWTLGEGAQAVAADYQADYALFINARGSYASGGRVATAIGMSLLGISVPLGQQQVFASLVDLKTGQIIWFNVAVAGSSADVRAKDGADALTQSVLKSLPL